MANDFLLTFSVDGRQALAMMDQIAQRAQRLEQQLNQLGRGGAAGGTSRGILQNLGLSPAQIKSTDAGLDSLFRKIDRLGEARGLNKQLGFQTSRSAIESEARAYGSLANAVGRTHPQFQQYVKNATQLSRQARGMRNELDQSTGAFGHHARRIAEGLLIYESFSRVLGGVASGIRLVIDTEREARRLEAPLDLDQAGGAEFIQRLAKNVAVETVTPLEDVVGVADTVAFALGNIVDPAERAAAAEALMVSSGRLTTVTQRGMAEETDNLIAIMKQLGLNVEDIPGLLDKVTAAGDGTSQGMKTVIDGLQVSAQAAKTAKVDINTLIALIREFALAAGRSGSETGNALKTLFATILNDPRAEKGFQNISNGLVSIFDASGNLRSVTDLFNDIIALEQQGVIETEKLDQLFTELAPPLNPGAKSDLAILYQTFRDLGPVVDDVMNAQPGGLAELVDHLNDALGAQFQKTLIEVQAQFLELFSGPILAAGYELLGLVKFLATALLSIPAPALILIAKFLAIAAAMKGVAIVGRGLMTIFGVNGLIAAVRGFGGGSAVAAGQLQLFGGSMTFAAGAARGLTLILSRILPLMAAFMAFDFAQQVGDQQVALQGQIGGLAEGQNAAGLRALRERVVAQKNAGGGNPIADAAKGLFVDPALNASIEEIDRLLAVLEERGAGAKVTMEDLHGSFVPATDAADDLNEAIDKQVSEFERSQDAAHQRAEAIRNMSAEERLALDAEQFATSLAEARSEAIADLDRELANHNITLQEHTAGLETVNEVSDLSARLVALYGDQLAGIPGLESAAAEGGDKLAEALFNMILTGEGNIDQLLRQGEALVQFGLTHGQIADHLNAHPLIVKMAVQTLTDADLRANPELGAAQRFARQQAFGSPFATSPTNVAKNLADELKKLLGSFGGAIREAAATGGRTSFGAGKNFPSGGASAPQTPILDIGDLDSSEVAKLVAIATRLRDQIPGEKARSADDIVALIKDAQFLQTVKGIDDRLLRLALEELTQVEKERLDLEKQRIANENLLKNLTTNVGPLGALISQPTAFGVGGNLALGQGLNVDPSAGNFTINVPVELQGTAENIQALVYQAIAQAMRDALRVGA